MDDRWQRLPTGSIRLNGAVPAGPVPAGTDPAGPDPAGPAGFALLGPVRLEVAGVPVDLGPAKQRCLLAVLLLSPGQPVAVETLVERVWGERPPRRERNAVASYVARLRRSLERAGAAGVATLRYGDGGYRIDCAPDRVDLHRLRRLADQARDPGCTDGQRLTLLREAVRGWRGEPLAGLPGDWAGRIRQTWRQQHLEVVVAWAHAELRAGDPAAVIAPLTDLTCEHPLAEQLADALIRALAASGRTADALLEYEAIRQRLVEQLGADPGPDLQAAHQAILRGQIAPAAAAVPAVPPLAATIRPVPAQLPPAVHAFAGRRNELAALDARLPPGADASDPAGTASATAARVSGALVIIAVSGTAGVGKTALAVHWAHRVAHRFPDGQLYANLRGFDPSGQTVEPGAAVRRFLDALGVPAEQIPADLDAQAALYRSTLAGKQALVVLDNARDSEQVRPLLPGARGCLAIVTSRNQLPGLVAADGAYPLTLELLTPAEARALLTRRLGAERNAAEPDAVQAIIDRCARLPLALATVAARAAIHPHLPLRTLAAELHDTRGGLHAFDNGDPARDVRAVFSWSYRALTPRAARLFRLLSLHPGTDLATSAAASLTALATGQVRPLLAELTGANLLIQHAPGRYAFHDLLRAYATELAQDTDTDEERRAATARMLDHYLHTAHTAAVLLDPHQDPITLAPPGSGVTAARPTDAQQALAWFAAEHQVLLAVIDHAAATGQDTRTWQLAWSLTTFLNRQGHWRDWAATSQAAVHAAQRLADPSAQATAHRRLGWAYSMLGRIQDARTQFQHALDLYGSLSDQVGPADTHLDIGRACTLTGRNAEALHHAERALDLYRAAGHRAGQALALNNIGWCHTLLGNPARGLAPCQQALRLHQLLGNHDGEAGAWDSLGLIHHHLGHHTQAIACYHHALDRYQDLGDRYEQAATLNNLGDTHHAAGSPHAAHHAWQQALDILTDLHHPHAEQLHTKLTTRTS